MRSLILFTYIFSVASFSQAQESQSPAHPAYKPIKFRYSVAVAEESDVTRRDPSDVIKSGGTYYVWYTKVVNGPGIFEYPSGYSGDVYYATSTDGHKFTERGLAVGKGGKGAWDEFGVFTPNILKWQGKFYLYYDGVPSPFDRNTPHGTGVAVSDSPDGPWKKFEGNPVNYPRIDQPNAFDSMRVCDSVLVVRDGKVWLYYKGRSLADGDIGPRNTHMGVTISDSPTGPFVRSGVGPLHGGHEVMVWPQGEGVVSLITNLSPRALFYAVDGLHFEQRNPLIHAPPAPGICRVDDFRDTPDAPRPTWGVCMGGRKDIYMRRFDIEYPD